MAKKRNAVIASALAAVVAFILAKPDSVPEAPVVDYDPSVTAPDTRGFGPPCSTGSFVQVDIFKFEDRTWNSLAVMPLRAAVETAKVIAEYRPPIFSGTYNCRRIRGSATTWSHHAWATAVDFDAPHNCLGCPLENSTIAQDPKFVRAFEAFGFNWGGRWSRPDAMHFEYDGPAIVTRPEVYPGMKGAVVTFLRSQMAEAGLPTYPQGPFRLKEIIAIIEFQRQNPIVLRTDDLGFVGDATWVLLKFAAVEG